jgi:hypothetical protein
MLTKSIIKTQKGACWKRGRIEWCALFDLEFQNKAVVSQKRLVFCRDGVTGSRDVMKARWY